ncbi:g-protein alpha subunit [Necator americanus]|uniref:G-protein alpha subunit n=1 Tax=Necator americanus TaxID=51031 RepID=W2TM59_NECAM|nr:g-protein alpha subunit [Necator americanus]ETN82823.1 g-protein alpha subunit [Necator americanus]
MISSSCVSCPDMGNCDSATAEMSKRSRKINAIIEQDKKAEETVIKLLLLGAGESGKSTILKQMKIIHDNGFSQDEAAQKLSVVCANTVQSMGALIDGMRALNISFASKQCTEYAALVMKTLERKEEFQPLTEEMYK